MKRLSRVLVAALLVLSLSVGVAAAETRTGDTVVVGEGETVDDGLQAFAGTVVVRGTVNGDLDAFAGTVVVTGTVDGDVNGFAGSVRVAGNVTGDVSAAGGDVLVEEGATVGGSLQAGAASVTVDGTVEGGAEVGADRLTLGPAARIGGDLEYDAAATRFADGAVVDGEIREVDAVGNAPTAVPQVPGWLGGVYGFLVNLALGAVLLLLLPVFSTGVARRATDDPLPSGGVGLLVLVGGPLLAILLLITLVGIPLALVGLLLWGLGLWVGFVYGAYAVGTWLYGTVADDAGRWGSLLVGLLAVTLVGLVPVLGGIVNFLVLLVGLGAASMGVWAGLRGRRGREEPTRDAGDTSAPGEPADA